MRRVVRFGVHPVYSARAHSPYKGCVYQSVDSETEESPEVQSPSWLRYGWIAALILSLVTVFIATQWGGSDDDIAGQTDPIGPEPEARQAYLKALGEPQPALRRARLTDFLTQHPENPRRNAARAQLDILNNAADKDWQATLTVAYDPRIDLSTRRAAVEAYQQSWGRYLGARDEEIAKLIEDVETLPTEETQPDRTLPRDPEQYAGIPDDRLAGGPDGRFGPRIVFRPLDRRPVNPDVLDGPVIAPRVLRNATPRYPRRALRRGEEAIVVLSLTIDEGGRVSETELIDIVANRYADDFIREAERAALRTRFEPQTIGGIPVETSGIQKRYRFEME